MRLDRRLLDLIGVHGGRNSMPPARDSSGSPMGRPDGDETSPGQARPRPQWSSAFDSNGEKDSDLRRRPLSQTTVINKNPSQQASSRSENRANSSLPG